ncbi:MAG: ATP synthase F0 subunit B, partial [Deltaproteobacteria bacterium]|nr:ATP synthase F0 subunit B [Deltaproteobacteria bacterium]
ILDYFSTRSEEIKKRFEDLRRDKEEAERKYREVEEQLRNFEEKRKDIIEQYRQEGIKEKDRIISEAKERVKQIITQSEITIEQEIESARNQLKLDIIDIASQRAQDLLAKELNEKDQENMVAEFVEKVGKVN